jgi:hypothetical protein
MRANRYLHSAVIGTTLLFLVFWQTAAAGPPEKPGNPGLPGCLAKVSELNDIVANQQKTIDQQATRIEELEDMLQNFAAVPQTGQWQSPGERDDGELQMGVQWPDPRFTDNSDGTVTDHLTGLIWLKNANCFGWINWNDALAASNSLADGQCGLSDDSVAGDWRLPNVRELHSLIDFGNYIPALSSGHPFTGAEGYYWSGTTGSPYCGPFAPCFAWLVDIDLGGVYHDNNQEGIYVWPVRGGD